MQSQQKPKKSKVHPTQSKKSNAHPAQPKKSKARATRSFESNYTPSLFLQPIKVKKKTNIFTTAINKVTSLIPGLGTEEDKLTPKLNALTRLMKTFQDELHAGGKKLTKARKIELQKNISELRKLHSELMNAELNQFTNQHENLQTQMNLLKEHADELQNKINE